MFGAIDINLMLTLMCANHSHTGEEEMDFYMACGWGM